MPFIAPPSTIKMKSSCALDCENVDKNCEYALASFPGPAQLSVAISVLQAMKSWAGPGNEAKYALFMLLQDSRKILETFIVCANTFIITANYN